MAEPLSPELRAPYCQSWHVAGRLNGIPRRTACGLALTPLPTHFRGSAEEGRPSLGALQAPLRNRLLGSTDSRRPSRAPDVHSAGRPSRRLTLPSCRSMRGRHEPSTGARALPFCATRGSDTVLTEMGQSRASAMARPATRSRRDETAQTKQSRSAPHRSLLAGSKLYGHFWADSGRWATNCLLQALNSSSRLSLFARRPPPRPSRCSASLRRGATRPLAEPCRPP